MNVSFFSSQLSRLNETLKEYFKVAKKTPEEVVRKQAKEFSFAAHESLKSIAPARGSVRAELIAKFKSLPHKSSGSGIPIRDSVRKALASKYHAVQLIGQEGTLIRRIKKKVGGIRVLGTQVRSVGKKKLNFQALLVQGELNRREQGIGYLSIVALMKGLEQMKPGDRRNYIGKGRQEMSSAEFEAAQNQDFASATMTMTLGSPGAKSAGEGMLKEKAQAALSAAVSARIADMRGYIDRKLAEAGRKLA